MYSSNELRRLFLDYFRERGHEVVPSSPLVPANDPTLLFTNAGMVQFKDVFLGLEHRPYVRATTSQRCVRAGGKHNDLENVGYTARHHTFFEMLGNFSFGDYFKREAIDFTWELLTQKLGLPPEKLWVTVFEEDEEAADLWLKGVGVDAKRFSRCGAKDNFWSMGDTGPCGPCSEVFYDHGPEVPGGPPGSPDEDGDRYIELWNLVFMQFNRSADGTTTPLPKPSVDTGMGLERLAAVMQGVHSNYDIDLFVGLIRGAAEVTDASDLSDKALRVIADHIRSCSFLVIDGVVPSNEGRGYVLRRIIRRAIRYGNKLGVSVPFFYRLVSYLEAQMGDAYPELGHQRDVVERVLKQEEEKFAQTLDKGMRIFDQAIAGLSGTVVPGETVFQLYDTYGFPVDLTADVAREQGLQIDMEGFEREMQAQRARSREASHFALTDSEGLGTDRRSEFTGYEHLAEDAEITALFLDGKSVESISATDTGIVVLDRTPFYSESGGQVGDRGRLENDAACFEVSDTQRDGEASTHIGTVVRGELRVADRIRAEVDVAARGATARHHSATHLLHAALREVLGTHVLQKGSLVAPDRLRFDFSHFEPVSREQLGRIERLVNTWVLGNAEVCTKTMAVDEALEGGALALFGEKYGDRVRVLSIGPYSTELCGGTHVQRSGDVGFFKITSETGTAAGIRRIEALAGDFALDWVARNDSRLDRIASLMKSDRESVEDKLNDVLTRSRELEKEVDKLKARLSSRHGDELTSQAVDVDGFKVLAVKLEGSDPKALRDTLDQLKNKLGTSVVVLATVDDQKVSLVAGVSSDGTNRIKAGPLVNFVAQQVGGRGGGRPDMAQAGGNDPAMLDEALCSVPDWVRAQLSA